MVRGENLFPEPQYLFKATTNGTTSDFDGNFTVSVENGQNVEVSYVGYTTQIIPYTGQDSLEVTLQEDLTELQEIVVTGYGTQKESQC